MEFGRVTEKELGKIDFSLPAEPAANKSVLGKPVKKPLVYLGLRQMGAEGMGRKNLSKRHPGCAVS